MPDIRHDTHIATPPTIKEELERKAFAELDRLVTDLDRGAITEAQFDTGLACVWNCVSGLVGSDLVDLIEEMSLHQKRDYSFIDSRSFTKNDAVIWIARVLGAGKVRVVGPTGTKAMDFLEADSPSKAALERQNSLSDGLIKAGWERRI